MSYCFGGNFLTLPAGAPLTRGPRPRFPGEVAIDGSFPGWPVLAGECALHGDLAWKASRAESTTGSNQGDRREFLELAKAIGQEETFDTSGQFSRKPTFL